MLPGFAANGQPSGAISSRFQSPLHSFANAEIFRLHPIAYRNGLFVVLARRLGRNLAEVEVENHPTVVDIDWNHEIGIHVAGVAVNHEVGILPEVPGAVAFAGRT